MAPPAHTGYDAPESAGVGQKLLSGSGHMRPKPPKNAGRPRWLRFHIAAHMAKTAPINILTIRGQKLLSGSGHMRPKPPKNGGRPRWLRFHITAHMAKTAPINILTIRGQQHVGGGDDGTGTARSLS
jgi:hypothetical protein